MEKGLVAKFSESSGGYSENALFFSFPFSSTSAFWQRRVLPASRSFDATSRPPSRTDEDPESRRSFSPHPHSPLPLSALSRNRTLTLVVSAAVEVRRLPPFPATSGLAETTSSTARTSSISPSSYASQNGPNPSNSGRRSSSGRRLPELAAVDSGLPVPRRHLHRLHGEPLHPWVPFSPILPLYIVFPPCAAARRRICWPPELLR